MTNRIHRMDPQLANQIAAGEIIERPASVIKELLENSLDAQAKNIRIDIENAGMNMRIRDDGIGIHPDDMTLALACHATSKIRESQDLMKIASLGFRGEALASISAVSRLTLISRCEPYEQAIQVSVEGREQQATIKPAMHPIGTTVKVEDLFFNTVARRRFLRSNQTEFSQIKEVVNRIALSRFDIGFELYHNDQAVIQLRAANETIEKEKRIAKLFGKLFMQQALAIDFSATNLRLHGWITLPDFSRSQQDQQYIYINGRLVRDRLLLHAIRQAYQDFLPAGRHPACILYLEMDPQEVDVNVHPTKHEVRFQEARLIHDFIYQRITTALISGNGSNVLINQPINFEDKLPEKQLVREISHQYQPVANKIIAQFHHYLLTETETGMMMIDIKKARAVLLQDQLNNAWETNSLDSLPLLIPQTLLLPNATLQIVLQYRDVLQKINISLELLSEDTLILRAIPKLLSGLSLSLLVESLINLNKKSQIDSSENLLSELSHAVADQDYKFQNQQAMYDFFEQCETLWQQNQKLIPHAVIQLSFADMKKLFSIL